ncbi:MAG: hypothetical protein RLZZ210_1419 [Pseudomonadota bacterium]|jgi:hypothetical protein
MVNICMVLLYIHIFKMLVKSVIMLSICHILLAFATIILYLLGFNV